MIDVAIQTIFQDYNLFFLYSLDVILQLTIHIMKFEIHSNLVIVPSILSGIHKVKTSLTTFYRKLCSWLATKRNGNSQQNSTANQKQKIPALSAKTSVDPDQSSFQFVSDYLSQETTTRTTTNTIGTTSPANTSQNHNLSINNNININLTDNKQYENSSQLL